MDNNQRSPKRCRTVYGPDGMKLLNPITIRRKEIALKRALTLGKFYISEVHVSVEVYICIFGEYCSMWIRDPPLFERLKM